MYLNINRKYYSIRQLQLIMKTDQNEHEKFMLRAITKAKQGIEASQSPFGACIVKDGDIISCEHNRVFADTDITAHAEIVAIKKACQKLNSIDLSGCVIYSTCEPCPMCFSACHWSKVSRIFYGAKIDDAKSYGFCELQISNETMKNLSRNTIEISGGLLSSQCLELFQLWSKRNDKKSY